MHDVQPKRNISSDDVSMDMDSKAVIVPVHMFASRSINKPTPIPGKTPITFSANTLITTAARKSITDYAGTTTSKATTVATTTSMQTSVGISTQTPVGISTPTPMVNRTIPFPAQNSPVNEAMEKSIHSVSTRVSMATSLHSSAGTLFTVREYQTLLRRVVSYIIMIIAIVC